MKCNRFLDAQRLAAQAYSRILIERIQLCERKPAELPRAGCCASIAVAGLGFDFHCSKRTIIAVLKIYSTDHSIFSDLKVAMP